MAESEQQAAQGLEMEDVTDDQNRGQPETSQEDKPTEEAAPKTEQPKESPRAPQEDHPPAQKEEPKKEEEAPKEEAHKEEPKKEEAKKPEPRKPEPPKEERPKKPEPKRTETRRPDGRGRTTEDDETGGTRGAHGTKKPVDSRSENKSVPEKSESSESRNRQKVEFFKEELKRLQRSLKFESAKIVPPARRKYKPFIFNTLEPYYNTHTTSFLIETPDESEPMSFTFSSRSTAQGLIDPWVDLRMDHEILPSISSRPNTRDIKSRGKPRNKKSGEPSRKEGSTRLPKFPVVALETKDIGTKQLYYSDVPNLRRELKNKYSSQAKVKVDADYKRTQQDFYRMDLDRLDQVAPTNRRHMTSTYMAYLQNTPGSRRAVAECVRNLEAKAH